MIATIYINQKIGYDQYFQMKIIYNFLYFSVEEVMLPISIIYTCEGNEIAEAMNVTDSLTNYISLCDLDDPLDVYLKKTGGEGLMILNYHKEKKSLNNHMKQMLVHLVLLREVNACLKSAKLKEGEMLEKLKYVYHYISIFILLYTCKLYFLNHVIRYGFINIYSNYITQGFESLHTFY